MWAVAYSIFTTFKYIQRLTLKVHPGGILLQQLGQCRPTDMIALKIQQILGLRICKYLQLCLE